MKFGCSRLPAAILEDRSDSLVVFVVTTSAFHTPMTGRLSTREAVHTVIDSIRVSLARKTQRKAHRGPELHPIIESSIVASREAGSLGQGWENIGLFSKGGCNFICC